MPQARRGFWMRWSSLCLSEPPLTTNPVPFAHPLRSRSTRSESRCWPLEPISSHSRPPNRPASDPTPRTSNGARRCSGRYGSMLADPRRFRPVCPGCQCHTQCESVGPSWSCGSQSFSSERFGSSSPSKTPTPHALLKLASESSSHSTLPSPPEL